VLPKHGQFNRDGSRGLGQDHCFHLGGVPARIFLRREPM
jgi:hypothetical protein